MYKYVYMYTYIAIFCKLIQVLFYSLPFLIRQIVRKGMQLELSPIRSEPLLYFNLGTKVCNILQALLHLSLSLYIYTYAYYIYTYYFYIILYDYIILYIYIYIIAILCYLRFCRLSCLSQVRQGPLGRPGLFSSRS